MTDPGRWWLCPNGRCSHGAVLHDADDYDDPSPRCCVDGCLCGSVDEADRVLAEGTRET